MKHLSALLILLLILMFPCFSSDEDLYRAASMGNPSDVVLAAVSTGSLFVEEEDGWNALFYAATNNAIVESRNLAGVTALMHGAVYNQNLDVLDELINTGAEIDTTSITGMSALVNAARHNNNSSITSRLLSHGVSIHSSDGRDRHP